MQSYNYDSDSGCRFYLGDEGTSDPPYLRFGGQSAPVLEMTDDGVVINAGYLQSANYNGSNAGIKFDLDNAVLNVYQSNGLSNKIRWRCKTRFWR